ncbi:MAG: type II secretion system F family protein [Thermoplasmata archaeon]
MEITFIILVPVSFLLTLYILLAFPDYKASSRRREISRDLEQAYTFISALANADVPLDIIFSRLSSESAFGEVSREAEKIVRLTAEGGMDIYTAMNIASRTSPSEEWRVFLQGAIATAASGSRLKPYFVEKALNFHERMRLSARSNSETLSLFAEVYVTIGVAFPLFLAIILGVMSVVSAPVSSSSQFVLLIFSFLIEPVIMVSFIAIVSSLNREVDLG